MDDSIAIGAGSHLTYCIRGSLIIVKSLLIIAIFLEVIRIEEKRFFNVQLVVRIKWIVRRDLF